MYTKGIGNFIVSRLQHQNEYRLHAGVDTKRCVQAQFLVVFLYRFTDRSSDFKINTGVPSLRAYAGGMLFRLPKRIRSVALWNPAPLLQRRDRAGFTPASLFTEADCNHAASPAPVTAYIHFIFRSKKPDYCASVPQQSGKCKLKIQIPCDNFFNNFRKIPKKTQDRTVSLI